MKRFILLSIVVLLVLGIFVGFTSCSDSSRMVEVSLEGLHPWEEACHNPMWHTLVWTDGKGGFQRLHLDAGTRTVRIPVPRGRSIVFCAYPLGELEPWGGVFHPLSPQNRLLLTPREGSVARLLQTLSKTSHGPINHLNYPVLSALLENGLGDDFRMLDSNRLGKDILNGSLSERSIQRIPPLEASLTNLPTGFWISADRRTDSFWFDSETSSVKLSLPGGLHRFLNREACLELRILVDENSLRIFQYIREPPLFLL